MFTKLLCKHSSKQTVASVLRITERKCSSKKDSPLRRLLSESATYNEQNVVDSELKWATLPYSNLPQDMKNERIKVDPKYTSVILFPGQGAQYVGMGKYLLKYPSVRDLYNQASAILKMDLLKLCTEGPAKELDRHCQLAVMVTSLATLERLKEERPSAVETCVATAGFSLGEITALVFAGALRFEEAVRLVQIRATAMEVASKEHPSGMITIMYGPDSQVNFAVLRAKQHCQELGIEDAQCQIANYLYPHCKVIAGTEEALKYIEKNAKDYGIRRVQRVKHVSGGFHTEIMRRAIEPVREAIKMCSVQNPSVTVISNVDGKPYRNEKHIRSQLPKQMIRAVRWEQSMHNLFARSGDASYPHVYTVGPGSNLRTILKQVNAKAWDCCIHTDS